jgi:hypothetical protein
MAITFKQIASGVKKVASKVKETAKKVISKVTAPISTGKQTASAYDAYNSNNDLSKSLEKQLGVSGKVPTKSAPTPTSYSGGTTFYNGNTPATAYPNQKSYGGNLISNALNGTSISPSTISGLKSAIQSKSSGSNYSKGGNYDTVGGGKSDGYVSQPVSFSVNAADLGTGTQSRMSVGSVATSVSGSGGGVSGGSPGTPIGNNVALGAGPNGLFPTGTTTDSQGNAVKTEVKEEASKEKTLEDYMKEQVGMMPKEVNADKLRRQAEKEAGLFEAQQRVNTTQNEINGITTKLNTDLLSLRGTAAKEGVTEAVYGGQQAELTREATIKLLPLQAQLAADQNNLELAKSTADDLFKYRYEDATRKADQWYKAYEMAKDRFTSAENKKIAEIKQKHDDNKSLLSDRTNFIQNLVNQAFDSGQSTLAKKLMSTMNNLPNVDSANFDQDLNAVMAQVQQYGGGIVSLAAQKAAKEVPSLPPAIQTRVQSIAGQFDNEKPVQDFNQIQQAKSFVDSLSNQTQNPSDDQALIYALAKTLDPTSSVREGEYATAQKYSQSMVKQYGRSINQAINGTGFLSEDARKNIKATINARYNSSLKQYKNVYDEYGRRINKLTGGNDGLDYITNYEGSSSEQSSSGQSEEQQLLDAGYTPEQIQQIKNAK